MSSVQAFNSVMDEFLTDLKETFQEERKIAVYYNGFLTLKKANPRQVMNIFMERATPNASLITSKDEKLFTENDDIIPDLQLSKLWNNDIDSETKNAIWQYLNTLYILGTTINSLPSNLLSTIEGVAEQCASQMGECGDSGNNKPPDMNALLAGMQNMIGNMMPPEQQRPKSSRASKKISKK